MWTSRADALVQPDHMKDLCYTDKYISLSCGTCAWTSSEGAAAAEGATCQRRPCIFLFASGREVKLTLLVLHSEQGNRSCTQRVPLTAWLYGSMHSEQGNRPCTQGVPLTAWLYAMQSKGGCMLLAAWPAGWPSSSTPPPPPWFTMAPSTLSCKMPASLHSRGETRLRNLCLMYCGAGYRPKPVEVVAVCTGAKARVQCL